jgi:2'-5' RNA ligase
MKKRLFIGIPLEQSLLAKIKRLENSIDKKLNWIPIEDLHITLVFLSWLEEKYLPKIFDALDSIRAKPFKLIIDKIDFSPNRRMIWLYFQDADKYGLQHGLTQIDGLQGKIIDLLQQSHIPFLEQNREFLGHINLVRLKGLYKKDTKKFLSWEFNVNTINLYESRLQKPYAEYKILKSKLL